MRNRNTNVWLEVLVMIYWRRARQPTPVFLPGEFHGQRNLAGYSPWGHKESDMTEAIWHDCTDRRTENKVIIGKRRVKRDAALYK